MNVCECMRDCRISQCTLSCARRALRRALRFLGRQILQTQTLDSGVRFRPLCQMTFVAVCPISSCSLCETSIRYSSVIIRIPSNITTLPCVDLQAPIQSCFHTILYAYAWSIDYFQLLRLILTFNSQPQSTDA